MEFDLVVNKSRYATDSERRTYIRSSLVHQNTCINNLEQLEKIYDRSGAKNALLLDIPLGFPAYFSKSNILRLIRLQINERKGHIFELKKMLSKLNKTP